MNAIRLVVLFACCAVAFAAPAVGQEQKTAPRLELKDVFELEYASDPQISPSGKQVVYQRNRHDIMTDRRRSSLWMIDTDGSEHRAVVDDQQGDVSWPRFSPDGKRLAYVVGGEGKGQIYLRWLDTGQTARLTNVRHAPGDLTWSPDGTQIAFSMHVPDEPAPFVELPKPPKGAKWAEPAKMIRQTLYRADGNGYLKDGYHQLFVVPAEGGTPRQLTGGPYHHRGTLAWTPDGKSILFAANRSDDWQHQRRESEIYRLSLADGAITALTDRRGPDQQPAVSPDGLRIAYVGYDDKQQGHQVSNLYVADINGENRRMLAGNLDRSMAAPRFSSDGRGIYVRYDDRGDSKLAFVPLDSKVQTVARNIGGTTIGRPYSSGSFSMSADGSFALTETRPGYPADVAVGRHVPGKKGSQRRITDLNGDLLAHKEMAEVEEFWYESSVDRRKIHGWLVKPPGFDPNKKYPLILEIHGGPFANYGGRFSVEMQLYAAAGYLVLYTNPRGSTGYGEEFGNLIHHAYPGDDFHDLMSGVDAVIARGCVDKQNLFVTGGSGGGILTSWVVGKTNRFRAAVAAKPVINWYSFVLTTDIYPFFVRNWFPGEPWKHAEHYLRRSPISLVDNVTTPTMLLTGEVDHRTPISESEQFYQALRLRKVDTALVRMPGDSHNIAARPSHLISKVAHILKWFEVHKKK